MLLIKVLLIITDGQPFIAPLKVEIMSYLDILLTRELMSTKKQKKVTTVFILQHAMDICIFARPLLMIMVLMKILLIITDGQHFIILLKVEIMSYLDILLTRELMSTKKQKKVTTVLILQHTKDI